MKVKLLLFALFSSFFISCESNLDEHINDTFAPVANACLSFVLYEIPIGGGHSAPIVLILLVAGALFFTLYFTFVNIRRFPLAINVVRGKYDFVEDYSQDIVVDEDLITREGDIPDTIKIEGRQGEVSHFQALTAAVSGTVGLGNIAGVAVAIAMGGPGATFWMIVAGLLGMSSKFVECTLGVKYRDVDEHGVVHGGPMYYLSKGLKARNMAGFGKVLAVAFAILCVGASFGGGNAFQSNQAVAQLVTTFGWESGWIRPFLGLLFAVVVGLVIIGGIKRIGKVTERVVPFMAAIYILAALIILGANFSLIDDAFSLILSEAFTPSAGLGGFVGVMIQGFRRAAFSNEAGVGSAAIAHSAVKTRFPASEGIVAMLEPFIDTVVICTMTALVIVFFNMDGAFVYGVADESGNVILTATDQGIGGVDLTTEAFESVIPGFSWVLTLAIMLFAVSTMLSWSYYGLQSFKYIFGRSQRVDLTYKILFLVFIVIGSSVTLDAAISFSDAMLFAMIFPNMIGLFFLFKDVRFELKAYLKALKDRFGVDATTE